MLHIPLLLIKQKLTTGVPSAKMLELYREQDTPNYKGGLKSSPAIFIEFEPVDMSDLTMGEESGMFRFTIRLVTDNLYDDDSKRLLPAAGIDHFLIASDIHKSLAGWNAKLSDLAGFEETENDYTVLNTIRRTRFEHIQEHGPYMRTLQSFECYIKDITNSKQYTSTEINTFLIEQFKLGFDV